jgi:hypothetical protein
MRTITLLLALAADPQPKPIPPERHEIVSRIMLRATLAQVNLLSIRERAVIESDQLRAAERERDSAARAWRSLLEAYQREFHAPGCEISVDKKWECQKGIDATNQNPNQ